MRKTIFPLLTGISLLLACGGSEKSPTTKDFQKQFSVTIPAFFETSSFDVEASENIGSKVEPIFKARFRATIKLKTPTYVVAEQVEDVTLIRPVGEPGLKKEIYGIAVAQLFGGSWKVQFNLENNPIPQMGKPKDFFTEEKTIVIGTEEDIKFKAEIERKQLAAAEEREKTEKELQLQQEKQKQEFERKRTEVQREREAARKAAELERIKRIQESKVLLESVLTNHRTYIGEASDQTGRFPLKIRFTSYDPFSGKIKGELEWPTLNALHKIEGDLSGTKLIFKETEPIKQGQAAVGCVYTVTSEEAKHLNGTYLCGSHGEYNGTIVIYIE